MLSNELLDRMRCMHTGSKLAPADPALVARVNKAIRTGSVRDREGRVVDCETQSGLINVDGSCFYPIVDDVLQMMSDECIDPGTIQEGKINV